MGWMGAIHTDVTELVELVKAEPAEECQELGDLGEKIQHVHGWVTPTVAGLTRSLITEVMERTPPNQADKEQLERVLGLLGTGR